MAPTVEGESSLGIDAEIRAAETPAEDVAAPAVEDDFEAAARAFCFTGEMSASVAAVDSDAAEGSDDEVHAEASRSASTVPSPRKRRGAGARRPARFGRKMAGASFTVAVMGTVGLFTLAMGAPAEAVAAASNAQQSMTTIQAPGETGKKVAESDIQAFVAPATVTELNRDETYQTTTFQEIASATGITRHTDFFVNDPTGAIQWPFAVGVPISYGYGARWGSVHHGLDFTPGEGADIQAIADGTVRIAEESGGAYGVYVVIDHVIDGQLVSSLYAHMLRKSLQVVPGQHVTVGTVLGHTGDTGLSYGAHTHFEITLNGTRIDPLPWLRQNAGG